MIFSATGRSSFAFAAVVTIPSAAISEAVRLASMSFSWVPEPPMRRPFVGVPMRLTIALLLRAQRQAALIELHHDLVERLLAEVGDGQQVVLGLVEELADGVHL